MPEYLHQDFDSVTLVDHRHTWSMPFEHKKIYLEWRTFDPATVCDDALAAEKGLLLA